MPTFKDLTGKVFGRWQVIALVGKIRGTSLWEAECACGKKTVTRGIHLVSGRSLSCGCLKSELAAKRRYKHGQSHKAGLYRVWLKMRRRTTSPNSSGFRYYGARGITCDKVWDDFSRFQEDMGAGYFVGVDIHRVDVKKGYSKNNCVWVQREKHRAIHGAPHRRTVQWRQMEQVVFSLPDTDFALLTPREEKMVRMAFGVRYEQPYFFKEIGTHFPHRWMGKVVSLSPSQVCVTVNKAVKKLQQGTV